MNNWHIVHIKQDEFTVEEDYEAGKYDSLQHITAALHKNIEKGKVGALSTSDEKTDGYYLIKFAGTPFTDQTTGELKCECNWLYPVHRNPF